MHSLVAPFPPNNNIIPVYVSVHTTNHIVRAHFKKKKMVQLAVDKTQKIALG
jgi:NifB/MoaA-like Fe-S oxidoreductase